VKLALVCRPFVFHGGVETATAGLVGELVRRGHRVDLLSPRGQEPVPGVTIRRLPVLPLPSLLRLVSFGIAARAAARAGDYDIVQSHERMTGADLYRAGEGTHRGYLEAMDRLGKVSPYHRYVINLETRMFQLKGIRHVVAISAGGKAEIERLYGTPPDRVSLVYNGVDLVRFHPDNRARHRSPARAEAGVPMGAFTVVFAGSGFERKGLATAIQGLAALADRDSRLLVLGKGDRGPWSELARRLGVSDRVVWLGPRPDIERWYAAADVVALPTRYEPFGNVHLEALASGIPVVTTTRAGGAEAITPWSGAVVEPDDAPALVTALEWLRGLEPARLTSAARAAAEPFTWERQVADFEQIYRKLPATRGGLS